MYYYGHIQQKSYRWILDHWVDVIDPDFDVERRMPNEASIRRWMKGEFVPEDERIKVLYRLIYVAVPQGIPIENLMLQAYAEGPTHTQGLSNEERWKKLYDRSNIDRSLVESLRLNIDGSQLMRWVYMIAGAREVEGFPGKLVELLDQHHKTKGRPWQIFDWYLQGLVGLIKPSQAQIAL